MIVKYSIGCRSATAPKGDEIGLLDHDNGQSVALPGDCGDIVVNLLTPSDALVTGGIKVCHAVEPQG